MQELWLKNYPHNVPHKIAPLNKTLVEEFQLACKTFADRTAFVSFGKKLSYKQLYQKAFECAGGLQAQGLKKEDVIVIQLPNLLQYPVVLWGSLIAGLKIINMNPLYTGVEMLGPLKESSAKAIVLLPNKLKELQTVLPQSQLDFVFVTHPADLLGFPKKQLFNFIFNCKNNSFKPPYLKQSQSFTSLLKKNTKANIVKRNLDDTLFIQYTGGTTGVIKGACLTQKNILSNLKQCELWVDSHLQKGQEVALTALPLSHVFSFLVNGLVFFCCGYTNVLVANPRDIKSLVKTIKKQKITIGTGVNTLFKALLSNKQFKKINFSNWKLFVAGGMALEPLVQQEWQQLTKSYLVQGYGLTEASPVVSVQRLDESTPNSVGYPLPSTQIRITNPQGKQLGVNQEGELEVKGPQVMKGYYKNPKETQTYLNDEGWFKTGDIAKVNPKGYLQIVERKKHMINISGLKVCPQEVENILLQHLQVKEACVIASKNKKNEEIVKAYVVKKTLKTTKPLTTQDLISHCKKNLTPFKIPKQIVFIEEIQKNLIGKALKQHLT